MRAEYRKQVVAEQWSWYDTKPAMAWEARVCAYLEGNVERSYCTRFRTGVRPFPDDESARSEDLLDLVTERTAKLDAFLKELSEQ